VDELEVARALADTKPVLLWSGETFSEVLEADVGATSAICHSHTGKMMI
jgi:hypothetical protein